MVELVGNIALQGLVLFTEERRRYYEKWYFRLLNEEQTALNAVYPHYSDDALAKVRKELEIFTAAYGAELGGVLKNVKINIA